MKIPRNLALRGLPLLIAALAVALALPSLWTGWQQDDLVHRYFLLGNPDHTGRVPSPLDMFDFMSGDTLRAQALMNKGVVPWWTLPAIPISLWRPITALSHWLDYVLWPDNSALMHLQSLFWFGALAAAAAFLYRRLFGPACVAGLAALLCLFQSALRRFPRFSPPPPPSADRIRTPDNLFSQSDNVVFLPDRNVVYQLICLPVQGGHDGERHYHDEHEGSKAFTSCS